MPNSMHFEWLKWNSRPVLTMIQVEMGCKCTLQPNTVGNFSRRDKCRQQIRLNKHNKCKTPSISIYAVNRVWCVEHNSNGTLHIIECLSAADAAITSVHKCNLQGQCDSDGDAGGVFRMEGWNKTKLIVHTSNKSRKLVFVDLNYLCALKTLCLLPASSTLCILYVNIIWN